MLRDVPAAPVELLACPSCGGDLRAVSSDEFACNGCGRSYPVLRGAPNLLLSAPADAAAPPGLVARSVERVVAVPAVYDAVQRLAGSRSLGLRLRYVLAAADGAFVLDAGAGTGNLERLLPPRARYLWLDADEQKLAGFRTKSDAPAVLGDATRIPLKDRSVDWAVSIGVSHHLDDAEFERSLEELRRVARERVVFLDAVWSDATTSRLLWRYDRGRYPRAADALREALAKRFDVRDEREFTVRHRYLLVIAS
jgi:SAM-dependent methyltransferase